jgi:TRAP-type C4-dicarboxylate transport system substrate-binding protein
MSPWKRLALAAAVMLAAGVTLRAAPVTVKLATIVPTGSLWFNALTDMGAAWDRTTAKRVTLVPFAGAKLGDEPTSIKLMRPEVNSVNAALLTSPGLTDIDLGFSVFGIPFFFQSDAEALHVRQKLSPLLAKRLEAKGYHLINWGHGGWIQLFSKAEVKTLADVQRMKLFTGQGDEKMVQWYTKNGFNPVPTRPTEIATALSTGLVEAAPSPAYAASVMQIYRGANFMLDLRIAPLFGATIVTDRVWREISPEDRAKVLEAGSAMEKRLDAEVPAQDTKAVGDMQARNKKLQVTRLDPAAAAAFRAAADKLTGTMRGSMVPEDVFDLALRERDAFRKTQGK